MHIVPVIDLKDGQVVHAKAGQRDHYAPIRSKLTHGSDAIAVISAFLSVYPFSTIYIADLDAIMHKPVQQQLITSILNRFPAVHFWLDAGGHTAELCRNDHRLVPVFGSESTAYKQFTRLRDLFSDMVLSLDFQQQRFIGDEHILKQTECWPETVILMNLDRVGTCSGLQADEFTPIKPDKHRQFYAAGGFRQFADFIQADARGFTGALVATSLHEQQLTRPQIETLSKKNAPQGGAL